MHTRVGNNDDVMMGLAYTLVKAYAYGHETSSNRKYSFHNILFVCNHPFSYYFEVSF